MANTAIWDVTDRLDWVIDYATNPQKTENLGFSSPDFQGLQKVLDYTQQDAKTEKQFYVTGINCDQAAHPAKPKPKATFTLAGTEAKTLYTERFCQDSKKDYRPASPILPLSI